MPCGRCAKAQPVGGKNVEFGRAKDADLFRLAQAGGGRSDGSTKARDAKEPANPIPLLEAGPSAWTWRAARFAERPSAKLPLAPKPRW